MDLKHLNDIIVEAKRTTYVGGGRRTMPSRPGSYELAWHQGDWRYLDSYFGGTNFIGQEVIWHQGKPIWGMNYYGYVLRPDLIDAERAGQTIKSALTTLYEQRRFLGGFEWDGPHGTYTDNNTGNAAYFTGVETIAVKGEKAYALDYCGGLIKA